MAGFAKGAVALAMVLASALGHPHRTPAAPTGPGGADALESGAGGAERTQQDGWTTSHEHRGAMRSGASSARLPDADCWLWPGASPRRCGETARVYLLQGHFYPDGHFEVQGPRPGRAPREGREMVLVYRMDRLPPNGALRAAAAPVIDAWRRRGWRMRGVQVDFDSPSAKLVRYARWIRLENDRFRRAGVDGITSLTGLGDWLVSGLPADLRSLDRAAGEIAFMFYHQGRGIEPFQGFIDALARSGLRFRLGLLPAQRHDRRFAALREKSGYLGDIVFHGMNAARE